MAMDPQLAHVDHFLKKFGQSLKCSEEFYEEGKLLAHKVFLKLQEKSKHSVASVHYGGSFGKKTDVIEPDLDLVVVCNNIEPPLEEVLDEFEDVLTLYEEELRIVPKPGRSKYNMFKKSKRSLNFCFYNGIDVDLLPAAVIEDKQEVIDKIKENPKNAYYYSPSLVKTQVNFLKRQDEKIASFVHTLIRLVKYWFKNLYFGEKVYGGSTLIELICVAIAEKENNRDSSSMLRAFAEVLDTIAKLDSLKLAFHQVEEKDVDEDERKWETVPTAQLHLQNLSLIPEIIGDEKILRRKYFMVEPANPFQDILEDKTPTVIQNFKIFASQTRQLLGELMKCNLSENEFIQMLFQPRPPILVKLPTLLLPNDLCIGCAYPCSFIVCGMQVRKEEVMKDDKKKYAIEVLKIRLLTVVNLSLQPILKRLQQLMSAMQSKVSPKPACKSIWSQVQSVTMKWMSHSPFRTVLKTKVWGI
ncbi:2'-5'-oligoadenylate synthase 3, partial [Orchesella cincta]